MAGDTGAAVAVAPMRPRIVLSRTHHDHEAEPQSIKRLEDAVAAMRRVGTEVREISLPALFADIEPLHRVIMAKAVCNTLAKFSINVDKVAKHRRADDRHFYLAQFKHQGRDNMILLGFGLTHEELPRLAVMIGK